MIFGIHTHTHTHTHMHDFSLMNCGFLLWSELNVVFIFVFHVFILVFEHRSCTIDTFWWTRPHKLCFQSSLILLYCVYTNIITSHIAESVDAYGPLPLFWCKHLFWSQTKPPLESVKNHKIKKGYFCIGIWLPSQKNNSFMLLPVTKTNLHFWLHLSSSLPAI